MNYMKTMNNFGDDLQILNNSFSAKNKLYMKIMNNLIFKNNF